MNEHKNRQECCIYAGQDLLVAGSIGQKGTSMIVSQKQAELTVWFSKRYLKSLEENNEIPIEADSDRFKAIGITDWEYVAEGGIFTALWNLSGRHQLGIEFDLRKIPVAQPVIEVCERYQLNPYRLYSENCLVMAADHSYQVLEYFQAQGIECAVIGKVNRGIKREIYHGEERGFLERPKRDELKKIYPAFFIK